MTGGGGGATIVAGIGPHRATSGGHQADIRQTSKGVSVTRGLAGRRWTRRHPALVGIVALLLSVGSGATGLHPAAAASAGGASGCTPGFKTTGFHEHLVSETVSPPGGIDPGVTTVPSWTGSFTTGGATYPYTMVGTDPAAGSATTTVPVVLVPLRLQFASDHCVLGNDGMAANLLASPVFSPAQSGAHPTQYADAFQRANFWSKVGTVSPDYHVLLGTPTVLPTQTLDVPAAQGLTAFDSQANRPYGIVGGKWLQLRINELTNNLKIDPKALAVFVPYNTYATDDSPDACFTSGCSYYSGYHTAALGVKNQKSVNTLIYADYVDYGDAVPAGLDATASVLSHEVLEWMDDPFAHGMRVQGQVTFFANTAPSWTSPYFNELPDCSSVLEVADPLEGGIFVGARPVGNPTVYLLANGAFLSWFARESPSTALGGRYDIAGQFTTYSQSC